MNLVLVKFSIREVIDLIYFTWSHFFKHIKRTSQRTLGRRTSKRSIKSFDVTYCSLKTLIINFEEPALFLIKLESRAEGHYLEFRLLRKRLHEELHGFFYCLNSLACHGTWAITNKSESLASLKEVIRVFFVEYFLRELRAESRIVPRGITFLRERRNHPGHHSNLPWELLRPCNYSIGLWAIQNFEANVILILRSLIWFWPEFNFFGGNCSSAKTILAD